VGFKSDYTTNLYSLYRERAKLFRQTLLGLNLFATAFFLFIVVPYYSAMSGSATLSNRIRTLSDEIPKLEKPVALLSQALEGTAKLETDMQHATQELREYVTGLVLNEPGRIMNLIGGEVPSVDFLECMAAYNGVIPLEGSRPPVAQSTEQVTPRVFQDVFQNAQGISNRAFLGPGDSIMQLPTPQLLEYYCRERSRDDQTNCQIRQFVYSQGCRYEEMWEQDVIRHLRLLHDIEPDWVSEGILDFSRSSFRKEVKQKLAGSDTFWHTVQGKEGLSVQIKDAAVTFWKKPLDSMQEVLKKRDNELKIKQTMLKGLLEEQKNIPAKQEELTKRLENIASPIGKLPLSVEEALLYFPLVVALVFLTCAYLHAEMGGLRKQYYDVCLSQDDPENFVTPERVETIAPTWVGTKPGGSDFLIGFLAFMTPGFMVAGVLFVIWSGTRYGQLEVRYSALAYLGALAAMIYAYRKIVKSSKDSQLKKK
jgi:hypothetical protein